MADIAELGIKVMTSGVRNAAQELEGLRTSGAAAETATTRLTKSMDSMVSVALSLAAAIASMKVADYVKDAVLAVARYETMQVVMHTMGNAAGYTSAQMDKFAAALEKQGISMLGAEESLAKMIQGNIDLEKGVRLATAAQGAAVVMGRSSTEAFEAMVTSIATGIGMRLHMMGVMVNFEEAYAREAAALKKSTSELTEREKVQARTNETLAKTKLLEDVYSASMGTAGKQLTSMVRYLSDLSVLLGAVGLDAFTAAVFGTSDALKATNAYLRELVNNGTIPNLGKQLTVAFTEAWKAIKLTVEVLGLFWLSWKSAVAIETAMLTIGLLKLEMRTLAAEITAAGGAWNFFTASVASSLPMFTTVSGILTGIASALSGILIGKYLVDNFKWAAEASLAMGETILTVWARIVGAYKIGIASLKGEEAQAEQALADKLLTIRMTYLKARIDLDKKFAPGESGVKRPEVLGKPEDQKAHQNQEKINAELRAVEEARKMLADASWSKRIALAELEGRDQYYIKSLEAEKAHADKVADIRKKMIGAKGASGILSQALAEENARFAIVQQGLDREATLQRAVTAASIEQNIAENMGLETHKQQEAVIRAKYDLIKATKAESLEGKNADRMQAAELAKLNDARLSAERGYRAEFAQLNNDTKAYLAVQKEILQAELDKNPSLEKELLLRKKIRDVDAHMQGDMWYAARDSFSKYSDSAMDGFANMQQVAGNFASSTENALVKAFTGGKNAFKEMADAVISDLVRMSVRMSITGPLFEALSMSGKGLGGWFSSLFNANGNVFGPTGVRAFAKGDIFGSSTFFSYAGGTGVMGEDGDEAVMPVTRNARGQLSVHATGSGGAPIAVSVNLINKTGTSMKPAAPPTINWDAGMRSAVIELVVVGIDNNEGGLRDAVKGVAG